MKTIYGIIKTTFTTIDGKEVLTDKEQLKFFGNIKDAIANLKFHYENTTGEITDKMGDYLFEVTVDNDEILYHIETFKLHGDIK